MQPSWRHLGAFLKLARSLRADGRFWDAGPRNQFTVDGFEVVPDLLAPEACRRLVDLADLHLRDESYLIGDQAYLVRRKQGPRAFDTQIAQIMHADELDEQLAAIRRSGRIEKAFRDRVGIPVVLETMSIQIDDVDTETKRGFHVDRLTPPTFKLFTYLTDVEGDEDGPYTVVPGSHRDVMRKIRNLAHNMRHGRTWTDMTVGYDDDRATRFHGPAGTTILSTQTLAHKGWPDHWRRRRVCLICYLTPLASWNGAPFTLGRDFVTAADGA